MLLDRQGIAELFNYSKTYFSNFLKYVLGFPVNSKLDIKRNLKYLLSRVKANDYPFWGNYYKSSKSNLNDRSVDEAVKRHFYTKNKICDISEFEIKYLNKIIFLCAEKNIALILVNTPLAPEYYERIPQKYKNEFSKIVNRFSKKQPSVSFIDYSSYTLKQNCYGDGDHINARGAAIISKDVNAYLNRMRRK